MCGWDILRWGCMGAWLEEEKGSCQFSKYGREMKVVGTVGNNVFWKSSCSKKDWISKCHLKLVTDLLMD